MSHIKKIIGNWSIAVIPFIFLLSIGLISSSSFTYHQKIFKTLMIVVFDSALLLVFIISIFGEDKLPFKKRKYFIYFLAYFLFIFVQLLVSFFSSEVSYDREYYMANYTLLILFSMFFFLFIKNIEEIKTGLLMFNIFIVIVLISSIIDLGKVDFNLGSFRPKLSFGNTNYFAGYLIGLLPLVYITPIIWWDKKLSIGENWISIVSLVLGVLGLIPLYFTQTRAAQLGAFVGIMLVLVPSLIYMFLKLPRLVKIGIVAAILIVFIATPVLLLKYPPPIVENLLARMVSTIENPVFYINDRLNGWAGGLGLFRDHPVFGAGLGTTYPASFKYIDKFFFLYSSSNSFKHSHNEYVQVLGEAGIVGLIAFISLFGFIIVNMLKRAWSKLYRMDYRLICLGTGVGLVSMLIQQTFSLTLRMSVTMTAYFFLLGLGVFLVSYSKKALLNPDSARPTRFKLPAWFDTAFGKKDFWVLIGVTTVLIIISLVLFMPVLRSENAFVKALPLGSKSNEYTNHYLKLGTKYKPDNPYAWTQKYQYDLYFNLMRSGPGGGINEVYFSIVEKNLDQLQRIIPDYQDVWSKYSQMYLIKYDYYLNARWRQTRSAQDFNASREALKMALTCLNKSLSNHFLNEFSHENRLLILRELDNPQQYQEALKDYIIMYIYLKYNKVYQVEKEKVVVQFSPDVESSSVLIDDTAEITISMDDVQELYRLLYEENTMNNRQAFQQSLISNTKQIVDPLRGPINQIRKMRLGIE
jgi:O-antigen ligase